ncbi:hypothetical protein [Pseudogemmobacter hezensis]|uniref:hypothetical protein n=1 Tax=Pseudogemmobacter hezensis TaxID=2737662 RepID=UPI001C1318A6|nr:hypothetical protein [Pseudogemmobacter hezensis]
MSSEAAFLTLCEALAARGLPMLSAMLIVAADMGVAQDSRTFARHLGVEHALALRELVAMEEETRLVVITRRDSRSQRLHFTLTEAAVSLLAHAKAEAGGADQP